MIKPILEMTLEELREEVKLSRESRIIPIIESSFSLNFNSYKRYVDDNIYAVTTGNKKYTVTTRKENPPPDNSFLIGDHMEVMKRHITEESHASIAKRCGGPWESKTCYPGIIKEDFGEKGPGCSCGRILSLFYFFENNEKRQKKTSEEIIMNVYKYWNHLYPSSRPTLEQLGDSYDYTKRKKMKEYPSINTPPINMPIFAYPKYDGQNLRWEWNKKVGFKKEKFGSKHVLIDENSNSLGKFGIPLLKEKQEQLHEYLSYLSKKVFTSNMDEVILFFEFFGPNTFAGIHDFEKDHESLEVKLIDVSFYKHGMIHPKTFKRFFSEKLSFAAPCIYEGNCNEEFIDIVRKGNLPGQTFEGVVCKGAPLKNGYPPYMFKLKNKAWVDKVKSMYKDPKKLEELL